MSSNVTMYGRNISVYCVLSRACTQKGAVFGFLLMTVLLYQSLFRAKKKSLVISLLLFNVDIC